MNYLKNAADSVAADEQPTELSDGAILEFFTKSNWWNLVKTKLVGFNFHQEVTLTYKINPRTQLINRLE